MRNEKLKIKKWKKGWGEGGGVRGGHNTTKVQKTCAGGRQADDRTGSDPSQTSIPNPETEPPNKRKETPPRRENSEGEYRSA